MGEFAVGAAAISEIVDNSEIIQEERAKLKKLQTEWLEKLREDEVELSIERANIARERTELEQLRRQFEQAEKQDTSDEPSPSADSQRSNPSRHRWLSRLGLKDRDEQ